MRETRPAAFSRDWLLPLPKVFCGGPPRMAANHHVVAQLQLSNQVLLAQL